MQLTSPWGAGWSWWPHRVAGPMAPEEKPGRGQTEGTKHDLRQVSGQNSSEITAGTAQTAVQLACPRTLGRQEAKGQNHNQRVCEPPAVAATAAGRKLHRQPGTSASSSSRYLEFQKKVTGARWRRKGNVWDSGDRRSSPSWLCALIPLLYVPCKQHITLEVVGK